MLSLLLWLFLKCHQLEAKELGMLRQDNIERNNDSILSECIGLIHEVKTHEESVCAANGYLDAADESLSVLSNFHS